MKIFHAVETGLYYYGARYYAPEVGRFMGVDPLADQFGAWTPYHYVHNNPLRYTDPTGMRADDIIVDSVEYEVGATGEGESEFVQQTFAALNQIANGTDQQASDLVHYFAGTEDYNVNISKGSETFAWNPVRGNSELDVYVAPYKQEITFNPTRGLMNESTGEAFSPDVGLLHELGHIKNAIDDPKGAYTRLDTPDATWGDKEEQFNIQKWEIPYARSRGMLERASYNNGIAPINTINSTNAITLKQLNTIVRSIIRF